MVNIRYMCFKNFAQFSVILHFTRLSHCHCERSAAIANTLDTTNSSCDCHIGRPTRYDETRVIRNFKETKIYLTYFLKRNYGKSI